MTRFVKLLALALPLLVVSPSPSVRAQDTLPSIFDLLEREKPYEATTVRLRMSMDSVYQKARGSFPVAFHANLDGRTLHFDIKGELRGKFRRSRCDNAPLKLDFDKKMLATTGLAKYDKYKLVTTCNDEETAQQVLLKEYLAYKAYAIVTPNAFRVQLLKITYEDADGNYPDRTEFAFLIEETDEMAHRLGGTELEGTLGAGPADFIAEAEATHALFQYFIGNADYSLPLQRNVKFVQRPDGRIIPVGYDFDFSGLVGAPYASPSREVGQQSIYQRVYLGYSHPDHTLRASLDAFHAKRKDIGKLINRCYLLEDTERQQTLRFVNRFFTDTQDLRFSSAGPLYDILRGSAAAIVPIGGNAKDYRNLGR